MNNLKNYRTKKGKLELVDKINDYFNVCDRQNVLLSDKKNQKPAKPYTLSGLLYHLDISAAELDELCEMKGIRRIILSAKRRIEAYIEENALNGNLSATAAFNSLKEHFGWCLKETATEQNDFTVELCEDAERFGG